MASGSGNPVCYQMLAANHPKSPTLLLKDYLRDDLSSCSSSGFKSLPRQQCCLQPRSSSSSSTKSALQKASEAVLNAIKTLPIPARQRSPPLSQTQQRCKAKKDGVLSRSLSRRLLCRSFWRRAASKGDKSKFPSTDSSASAGNNNNWTKFHFTCGDFTEVEGSVTTTNTCSITNSTRVEITAERRTSWSLIRDDGGSLRKMLLPNILSATPRDSELMDCPNEKEQFSPVSVLDCPLFDDDEEITSPFNSTCSRLEGAKHKHMQKGRHFNRVASLKPVALEKRISWSELPEDEPIYNHPTKPCPVLVPIMCTQNGNSNLLHDNVEENARDLLNQCKRSNPSNCSRIEAENLLSDFFKQSIGDNNDIENSMKRHLCKVAEDWVCGQPREQYLSWHVGEGRQVYIREMDKCGSWRNCDEEIQHMAMELEVDFSTSLVNELVLDLTTC